MLTKTKLALAATLVLGSATLVSAEGVSFDAYAPAAVQHRTLTTLRSRCRARRRQGSMNNTSTAPRRCSTAALAKPRN